MNDTNYLVHHGIEGQKWGVRRFQNRDGSLTEEGRKRYGYSSEMSSVKDAYRNKQRAYRVNKSEYERSKVRSHDKDSIREAKAEMDKAKRDYSVAKREYKDNKEIKKQEQRIWKQQRRDYIQTKSFGEKVLTGLLLGPAGLYNYNTLMAQHPSQDKVGAFAKAAVTSIIGGPLGNAAISTALANRTKENY